jgi:PAS domain S-box-containing protein
MESGWIISLLAGLLAIIAALAAVIIMTRTRAEQNLRQYQAHLQEMVAERTADLQAANELLQQQVAERKQIEEELWLTQFSVQYASHAVFWINRPGRLVYVNEAACSSTGYAREELLAMTIHQIDPNLLPAKWPAHWQNLVEYGCLTFESRHRTQDGRLFPVEITANHLQFREKEYVFVFARDITVRKQAEAELLRAKEVAEAASRAKSGFLANMSHELRTPLNAILGFAQLMARDPQATPDQLDNIKTIIHSGEHLLGLINDVLTMSKIEAGRITLSEQSFNLYHLLDGLEELFCLRAEDKGLMLTFDRAPNVPEYICSDESKLRQVLMNLLSNAIKFTQEGGVTVRVGSRDYTATSPAPYTLLHTAYCLLRFEVEDTGPGIPPEDVTLIFDSFVQTASGQKAAEEGTGLGLPISRQFVRLMGGDLTVNSQPGHGSTFGFELQVEVTEAADLPAQPSPRQVIGLEADQPAYRLLIAEDKEASRRLLIKLLVSLGFEVQAVANGQEAVEAWRAWQPHLVWMDMHMPVMDGYEATRRIKATPQGQATVIVALTASVFEEDRAMILAEGCDDFLRKPFREAQLFEMLIKHLNVRFLYADQTVAFPPAAESAPPDKLTPATLAALPAEWAAQLHQAATQADADLILELLDQIRPQQEGLAAELEALVQGFRFDRITTLIEQREQEHAHTNS